MREKIIDALNGIQQGLHALDARCLVELNAAARLASESPTLADLGPEMHRRTLAHARATVEGWLAMLDALEEEG
jgi:hypothetical protein